MIAILIILLIVIFWLLLYLSEEKEMTLYSIFYGVVLWIVLSEIFNINNLMRESAVKEYIGHPENYKIEYKYQKDTSGTFIASDTIVTRTIKE